MVIKLLKGRMGNILAGPKGRVINCETAELKKEAKRAIDVGHAVEIRVDKNQDNAHSNSRTRHSSSKYRKG